MFVIIGFINIWKDNEVQTTANSNSNWDINAVIILTISYQLDIFRMYYYIYINKKYPILFSQIKHLHLKKTVYVFLLRLIINII